MTTSAEPELVLREAVARDRRFVLELAGQALTATSSQARAWVEGWWSSSAVGRYLAALDGERAGFYLLGFMVGAGGHHLLGEVLAIAVHPRAQRRGVGRAMLEHAALLVATAEHAAPLRTLEVRVAGHNQTAQALYRSAGFVDVEDVGVRYPDGTPARRLQRVIDAPSGAGLG